MTNLRRIAPALAAALALALVALLVAVAPARAWAEGAEVTDEPAAGEASAEDPAASGELELKTLDDVARARIGATAGGVGDRLVKSSREEVSDSQFSYFNNYAELVLALQSNKIDAFVADLPVARLAVSRNTGLGLVPEVFVEDHYGFALQKNSPLTAQFNEVIGRLRADGTTERVAWSPRYSRSCGTSRRAALR